MAAMSRSSNNDICKAELSASALMAGARNAVIQSRPAGAISASRRACVIIPRSPTSTTCVSAKRLLILSICERARIGGVALEHFDRYRATVCGAQQAIDDLQLALLAVAAVAEFSELATAPLQVA